MSFHTLLATSCQLQDYALVLIRILVGIMYIKHGWGKVIGGKSEWIWMGEQMKNLGITWFPIFWGLAATFTEFGGGIMLTLGLGTRISAALMAFTMFVAVLHHISNNDSWGYISFPLSMMVVFIGLIISGSGSLSIDAYLLKHIIR